MPISKHKSKKQSSSDWRKKRNIRKYETKKGNRTTYAENNANQFTILSTIFQMFKKRNLKLR